MSTTGIRRLLDRLIDRLPGTVPPFLPKPSLPAALLAACLLAGLRAPAAAAGDDPSAVPPGSEEPSYVMGVFPFLPAARLEGIFAPLAAEIGEALGRRVHYRSASSFEKFTEGLADAEYDIAHIQPFDYVLIAAGAGYIPVADRREQLFGSFYVPADSPVRSIEDLRGKDVSLPPDVAAISQLAKIALIRAGLKPNRDVRFHNFKGHHSCLQQVVIGNTSACATGPGAARSFEASSGIAFRPLEKFPDAPYTIFVIHERVPPEDRGKITKVILSTTLQKVEPELRTNLMKDEQPPFVPIDDSGFDQVRDYWKQIQENQ